MAACEANVWKSEQTDGLVITPGTCRFRGEGNSSLVVTLSNKEQVLRLQKSSTYSEELGCLAKRNRLQADFIAYVMRKLLGHRFVQLPVLLPLTAQDIVVINDSVKGDRPVHRTKKHVPEVPTLGLLLPDYCTLPSGLRRYSEGPVLAVEIKPKQGFLPSPRLLPGNHAIKASVCRFHLTQNYKKSKGTISTISRYCPLDLFSGCPERTRRALKELVCHPQNNLRVFKNRELVFCEENKSSLDALLRDFFGKGDPVGREDQLCRLVGKVLRRPFRVPDGEVPLGSAFPDVARQSCPGSSPCTCFYHRENGHALPRGSVLERILRLQCLSSADVTVVYPLYRNVAAVLNSDSDDLSLCKYLRDGFPSPSLPKGVGKPERQAFETDLEFTCRKVWEFLVSLTAKDCSIMVSLQRLSSRATAPPKDSVVGGVYGEPYLFSVAIVDLDPKALCKLEKAYYDDCRMVDLVS